MLFRRAQLRLLSENKWPRGHSIPLWKDYDDQQKAAFNFAFPSEVLRSKQGKTLDAFRRYYGDRVKAEFGHTIKKDEKELQTIDFADKNFRANYMHIPREFLFQVKRDWRSLSAERRAEYEAQAAHATGENSMFPLVPTQQALRNRNQRRNVTK
jgi:hypothetical protein